MKQRQETEEKEESERTAKPTQILSVKTINTVIKIKRHLYKFAHFQILSSEMEMNISSQYIFIASLSLIHSISLLCRFKLFVFFFFYFFFLFIQRAVRFIALFDFWLLGHLDLVFYYFAYVIFYVYFVSFFPLSHLKFDNLHILPAIFGMIF